MTHKSYTNYMPRLYYWHWPTCWTLCLLYTSYIYLWYASIFKYYWISAYSFYSLIIIITTTNTTTTIITFGIIIFIILLLYCCYYYGGGCCYCLTSWRALLSSSRVTGAKKKKNVIWKIDLTTHHIFVNSTKLFHPPNTLPTHANALLIKWYSFPTTVLILSACCRLCLWLNQYKSPSTRLLYHNFIFFIMILRLDFLELVTLNINITCRPTLDKLWWEQWTWDLHAIHSNVLVKPSSSLPLLIFTNEKLIIYKLHV